MNLASSTEPIIPRDDEVVDMYIYTDNVRKRGRRKSGHETRGHIRPRGETRRAEIRRQQTDQDRTNQKQNRGENRLDRTRREESSARWKTALGAQVEEQPFNHPLQKQQQQRKAPAVDNAGLHVESLIFLEGKPPRVTLQPYAVLLDPLGEITHV